MVKAKLYRQNHTKKHTHTHSQKEKKEKYIYIFWEVRGLLPAFSRCSVGVVSHVDVFLTYLWGGRWSPCLTPQPSWRSLLFILFFKGKTVLIPRIPWSKDTCFLPWRKCFYSYFIYLFIYFLAVLGLRFVRGLSPVTASGGHSSSRCGDRSSSRCAGPSPPRPPPPAAGHRLQTRRLSSRGSRAQPLRGTWDPPRPGPEPVSPALAGRLSTTAPPGKPGNAFKKQDPF